jgi:hypothetical protein
MVVQTIDSCVMQIKSARQLLDDWYKPTEQIKLPEHVFSNLCMSARAAISEEISS